MPHHPRGVVGAVERGLEKQLVRLVAHRSPWLIEKGIGADNDTYAQLGHGGRDQDGDNSGEIRVTAVGDINFNGGTESAAYAMLGHGGHNSDALTSGHSGGIKVSSTTGDINFAAR